MENTELIRAIKDIGIYHELALQKCKELIEEVEVQAADSSAACKKKRISRKQKREEFFNSDECKKIVARRNFAIQKGIK